MLEKTALGIGVAAMTVAAMFLLWGLDLVTYGLAAPALVGVAVYSLLMFFVMEGKS